jgi:hypothetical protein
MYISPLLLCLEDVREDRMRQYEHRENDGKSANHDSGLTAHSQGLY